MLWNVPPDVELSVVRQRIEELQADGRALAHRRDSDFGGVDAGRVRAVRTALGRAIIGLGVAIGGQPVS